MRNIKTVEADRAVGRGRLAKAKQFMQVADDARELADDKDVADAAATLYVHAGIAAADAIGVSALGKHAHGDDHNQAVKLLGSVDKNAGKHLSVLLGMKTRSSYGHHPVGVQDLLRAHRASQALVQRASI